MARHTIIGKGKLGIALANTLRAKGHEVTVMSKSTGFDWPLGVGMLMVLDTRPNYVWCAVSSGSVQECESNYTAALNLNVGLPMALCKSMPSDVRLIFFSTDYVASELSPTDRGIFNPAPKSFYAMAKFTMEQNLYWYSRRNSVCVRIGNLYSASIQPEKCLPGKLVGRYPKPCRMQLPENTITPTPVEWLSNHLVNHCQEMTNFSFTVHHIAPEGNIRVCQLGQLLFPKPYEIIPCGIDSKRPAESRLGCSIGYAPHWFDLWKQYGQSFHAVVESNLQREGKEI